MNRRIFDNFATVFPEFFPRQVIRKRDVAMMTGIPEERIQKIEPRPDGNGLLVTYVVPMLDPGAA